MTITYPKGALYAQNGQSYYFRHEGVFKAKELDKIETHYEAKYVCDTCVKNTHGGWANRPVAIFYQADMSRVPKGGSHWFGLYFAPVWPDPNAPMGLMITNGLSATEQDIDAVVATDGEIVWSRYRHDYRVSKDGTVWIDGGRDYTRYGGGGKFVTLRIVEDKLIIVEAD